MAPAYNGKTTATELVTEYASEIAGKTVLVTGVSPQGLGDKFVSSIAVAKPAALILSGRNPAKFQALTDSLKSKYPEINVKTLPLDLGSFASTRKAAETVNKEFTDIPHIDVLMLNAGIMGVPYALTEDGIESQFQTCHLSHFLFTNLIMDKILASPTGAPRVICVSSRGHGMGSIRWTDYNFNDGKRYDRWLSYGQAKTANMLMAVELARRLGKKGLRAYSLHPGAVVSTNLAPLTDGESQEQLMQSIVDAWGRTNSRIMWGFDSSYESRGGEGLKNDDEGTATHVFTAFDPKIAKDESVNGAYFHDCHVANQWEEEIMPHAKDPIDAQKLWALSEKLVGQEFAY